MEKISKDTKITHMQCVVEIYIDFIKYYRYLMKHPLLENHVILLSEHDDYKPIVVSLELFIDGRFYVKPTYEEIFEVQLDMTVRKADELVRTIDNIHQQLL